MYTEYRIYDSLDNCLKCYNSYKSAETYKIQNNRHDWSIKRFRPTTERQKNAVHFVEEVLYLKFEGDINNHYEVSPFLDMYLEEAKETYSEIKMEYESYMWDLDND